MNVILLASFASYVYGLLMTFLSLFLILLVLIQRGRGGGLAGALGGPGGQSAFGSKAGDTFTMITVVVAAIWGLTCALAMWQLGQHKTPASTTAKKDRGAAVESMDDPASAPGMKILPPSDDAGGIGGIGGIGESDDATKDGGSDETPSVDLTPKNATDTKPTDAGEATSDESNSSNSNKTQPDADASSGDDADAKGSTDAGDKPDSSDE